MSIVFFGQPGLRSVALARPVTIMFLTSLRDVVLCDKNGDMVDTPDGPRYMEGIIERTVKETKPGGALYRLVSGVSVVADDSPKDLGSSHLNFFNEVGNAGFDRPGQRWVHPPDLSFLSGGPVMNTAHNCPSDFRGLSRHAVEQRRSGKLEFETEVRKVMEHYGNDLIVSDHFMAKIEYLHQWFPGRVLNIHPAVTLQGHEFCFRGPTPTADAIAAAQTRRVFTGATLHLVDGIIDHGPVIAYAADTPVYAYDEPQWLRYRNYQAAKLPVFISGLVHYLTSIYPYLGELDFTKLVPL